MKRSHVGYRAGYHPPAHALERLVVHERTPSKSARNYKDPRTGKVYSQRAVQEARNGYLHIETARDLRRGSLRADISETIRNAREAGLSITTMANRYRVRHEMTLEAVMASPKFWESLSDLSRFKNSLHDTFGENFDHATVLFSEARAIWKDEDYEAWDDDDIPFSDIDDFFFEWDYDSIDDLWDDFGITEVKELGHYH